MSQEVQSTELLCHWFQKSEENLTSARKQLSAGAYALVMRHIYYAAFYAVSALCLSFDHESQNSPKDGSVFQDKFINTGILDSEWGKFYDSLFQGRNEGDYLVLLGLEPNYVKQQLELCMQFLEEIKRVAGPAH